MKREIWRHLAFAALFVLMLVGVRYVVSVNNGLGKISRFEAATSIEIGPDVSFFGAGLHGDAATFAIVGSDPLGVGIGAELNEPSYRYSRFGYPLLASGLVGGSPDLLLLGLSFVGLASAGAIAILASKLNESLGWRSWLLVVNPALLLGVINDTAEPLAILLLTVALSSTAAWLRLTSGVAIAIVRPSYIVALFGPARVFALALATVVVSKVFWSLNFDEPVTSGGHNLDWPLFGILEYPSVLGWTLTIAAVATVVFGVLKRDWGWAVGGIFVLFFSAGVFHTPTNALRAAGYLPVLWAFGPNWRPGT